MTEEKSAGIKGAVAGWIKAGMTSVVGLVSGAMLMYLTPIINNTIKPAKPFANFAAQSNGLSVTFNNLSTGGVEGWWDYGDGSALEPFVPKTPAITHAYDKPGSYSVKLSLTNLIGEESDRTVPINLDASSNNATTPEITLFDLKPVTPGEKAPAVYRLQSKIKNATLCILSMGDDRPMQLDASSEIQERYVTFDEMGAYHIRLAAVNGKNIVEKGQTVYVSPNEGSEPMAKLLVSYDAVRVDRMERHFHVPCVWHSDGKQSVSPIHIERGVNAQGYAIISAEILNKDEKNAPVRKLNLELAPDKTHFILTGELVRSSSLFGLKAAPSWKAEVKLVMERRSAPVTINRGDVTMAISFNTVIKIPVQPLETGWEVTRKQVTLELWDGTRKVWESNQGASNVKVTLKNQSCYVTAVPQDDSVVVKIDAPSRGPSASAAVPHAPMIFPPATLAIPKGASVGNGNPAPSSPSELSATIVIPNAPPIANPSSAVPLVVRPASFDRLPYLPRPK